MHSLSLAARSLALLAALLLAMPSGAQTLEEQQRRIEGNVQIGSYTFGKTVEDILATHPGVAWEIKHRDGERILYADAALSFADQRFDVIIAPESRFEYLIEFGSITAGSRDACQRNVLKVMGALESKFGFFRPSPAFLDLDGARSMKAGRKSSLAVNRDDAEAMWDAERVVPVRYDGYYATVHTVYKVAGPTKGCWIIARVMFQPEAIRR